MTIPLRTPKLLKECLDDLDEERLKEFQWYLVQIEINGSRPIPRSKLENATREETVDKLVEAFGEDGAVAWTVETFFEMESNALAFKLIQAKMDQSPEQKEGEPETSSAREKPREVDPTVLKDLSCSICLSLFTDPVMLQCGHSFCQTCIHKDWDTKIVRECSLCKQFIPDGDPPINFSLKSLCENYRGRSQDEPSGGHRNNTESFQTSAENIREKQEAFKEAKKLYDSSIEHIKTQSFNTENEIMDVFKMLHDLLKKEEETRRAALREEGSLKICMIDLMHQEIKITCSLSDTMAKIAKLGADKRFTKTRATQKKRASESLKKLRIHSKAQIDVSKHLRNLPLTVLEKMLSDIKQTSVVVDPKTESSSLSDDDHQTEVKFNDTRQLCPGNPERSSSYQLNLQKSPKRSRVEPDNEDGKESFHDPDKNTSIQNHEGPASVILDRKPISFLELQSEHPIVDPVPSIPIPFSVSDHRTKVKFNDELLYPVNTECSSSYQQKREESHKERRVEQDYEDGKESFHDPDNNTSILTHEETFTDFHIGAISLSSEEEEFDTESKDAETFREDGAQS